VYYIGVYYEDVKRDGYQKVEESLCLESANSLIVIPDALAMSNYVRNATIFVSTPPIQTTPDAQC
jgi:hypothetical protein